MATKELRKRTNWPTKSGAKALKVEELFQTSLQNALDSVFPDLFLIDRHTREFRDSYSTYKLSQKVLNKIYNVDVNEKQATVNLNIHGAYQWTLQ
ncbi:MAG: MunI family type II restriction endonuclease [Synergistaceae bacterium]|nr:MunI family type II restriction endonuclease [Synergistaceae bacterium]